MINFLANNLYLCNIYVSEWSSVLDSFTLALASLGQTANQCHCAYDFLRYTLFDYIADADFYPLDLRL